MKCQLNHIVKRFKNIHVVSWFILSLTILYIFISILFEFQDWLMAVYAVLLVPLMIGLNQLLKEELIKPNHYGIHGLDGLMAFLGVLTTYTLSHQLEISAVIASSAVGLLGYFIIRKHSVAVFCGSFAGMVSSFLFGYVEVALIGFLCGALFMLFKPVMKGMGGKLGTTAFISTMIFASILNKDFLIIDQQVSFLRLVLISLLGTMIAFYLQHLLKQTAVFASASVSLIFALVTIYVIEDYLPCAIVFFSASFVGMSSRDRLPNIFFVILAGLIHAFLYYIYFDHYNGLGGKLGLMALTSVVITLGIKMIYEWTNQRIKFNKER